MKTGWPPGLLQDDDRRLSQWLANRPGARHQVRKNIMTQQPEALRLASMLRACFTDDALVTACAAELRRLHAENRRMASELARPMTSEATLVLHDNTRLRKINKQLLEALEEAAGDIESWGAYAAEYFQKKHNLLGAVRKARAAIAAAKETQ